MPDFLADTFDSPAGTLLQAHVGEVGATWTKHPAYAGGTQTIENSGQLVNTAGSSLYIASGLPTTPDYDAFLEFTLNTNAGQIGLSVRTDPLVDTRYRVIYDAPSSGLFLQAIVAGGVVDGRSVVVAIAPGTNNTIEVQLRGTNIRVYLNATLKIDFINASVTAAGRVGVDGSGANTSLTGGSTHLISAANATPTAPRRSLFPQYLTYCVYTPATATKLSSLTIWMLPRNIVLKDAAADNAWAYIQSTTPGPLQF